MTWKLDNFWACAVLRRETGAARSGPIHSPDSQTERTGPASATFLHPGLSNRDIFTSLGPISGCSGEPQPSKNNKNTMVFHCSHFITFSLPEPLRGPLLALVGAVVAPTGSQSAPWEPFWFRISPAMASQEPPFRHLSPLR